MARGEASGFNSGPVISDFMNTSAETVILTEPMPVAVEAERAMTTLVSVAAVVGLAAALIETAFPSGAGSVCPAAGMTDS